MLTPHFNPLTRFSKRVFAGCADEGFARRVVLCVLKRGCPWRMLPEGFYGRYARVSSCGSGEHCRCYGQEWRIVSL
jgi:hypothetical protein